MIKQIQEINFPDYATLSQATITLNDMGDKTISTQVKIDGSIIPDFSYDWEVEFKGERYIHPLRQPQAGKSNDSISSKIDLVFQHKTIYELKRYYFVEMTSTMSGTAIADQYIASLGLNLDDFCVAFQRVLDHYFNGEIIIDLNPNIEYTKGVQFMSISYSYIWDVLQKVYEVYGVRWTIEGNTIKVGYPSTIVSHTFQYGYEGGLLQVERQVQDANIRNSLLGRGGEQNLPAYYFKEAPEGSLFASDPDAIPELANVYFSNLRGKTFRDYVKGWKAKHYGGMPMSEPTDAYTKGYTDTKFNPIEYVEDKESIKKYGLLQGGLDNNEEIFPSIQGAPNGEDVVVYVEPVTSDDVESSVSKVDAIVLNGMSQYRSIPRELNGGKVNVTLQSEVFEVKEDNYALVIGNNVSYSIYRGFSTTPAWEGNPLVNVEEVVVNKDTNEVANKDSLLKGKYQVVTTFDITLPIYDEWPTIGSAENITFYAQLGVSTNLQLRKLQDSSTDKWLPTFNIWVKNIWHSTRNDGENDLEYAERVWRPILGDRQGNEAKVVFSSGWLSGHEDYEFTIVDFAYDNSHEDSEWRLTLAKSDAELEATGKYIPSASTNGQAYAGDTFFFIGIDMPHQYVLWGEERVDNWKKGELDKTSEIQPKWVVRLDKLRLNEENDNLVEQIKEGNAINLADVRFIDAPALQLYLQSVTYTWSEQTLLYPDIEVVLADTIVPVQNPVAQLQGSIDTINSQLANIGNVAQVVRKIGDSLYLRKDGVADTSKSPTNFVGNVSGNNFRQGKVGGADWGIYRDENGNAIAEFDKIIARKDLEVNNLVINQVSYVGGMQITSAASLEITRVIENDNAYQCFFDQKGGSVGNLFQVNDIAYSQRFDEENNTTKYYKRVVIVVDIDSITLSKSQADGEGVPMANDVVIHYGNTTDTNRQYVIIRDVIGGGYERMLSDLNSVSATGVEYYFAGRMDGDTPRWFVGNNEQFIEYKDGHLQINADVTLGSGSDLSASEEFQNVKANIDSFDYLKQAMAQNTSISGGLIQTTLLQLGYIANGALVVQSGTNGIYDTNKKGGGIAAWWGGEMLDKEVDGVTGRVAQALIRMDGTGYFAGGNITWDAFGAGSVANGNLYWDKDGNITLSDNIRISSDEDETLGSVLTSISKLQSSLSTFKDLFDSMFEKDIANNAIKARLSLYSLVGITAGGVGVDSGNSGGSAGGGSSYNRLDSWLDYTSERGGWVLSALLGKDLDDRVSALANAGYVTQSALAPYALRSELPIITKDGLKSTLGISDWALASVKPTYTASEVGALSLNGGTVTGEFIVNGQPIVTKAGNATIIFSPNNREQNYWFGVDISGSLFITDNGYNKVRTIIHEDNIGHYKAGDAGNSDKLGWVEASKYFKGDSTNLTSNINADNLLNNACYLNATGNGSGNENFPHSYSIFNVFTNGSDSRVAQVSISNDGLAIRRKIDSWGEWRHYINTANIGNYNAGSATKLQTPRTIWGQSFDGTGNVGGDLYVHQFKIELGNEINSYNDNFNTANGDMHLNYRSSGLVTLAKGGGNVAIGGLWADEKLHVYGNGKFTGALTAPAITTNTLKVGNVTLVEENGALKVIGGFIATGGVTSGEKAS